MEVITFCITLTAIMAMCLIAVGILIGRSNNDDKGNTERANGMDNSSNVYVPSRDRDRGGDNGCNQQMDAETAINALQVMRMSCKYSETEKDAIDYAIICIDVAQKLAEYWKG